MKKLARQLQPSPVSDALIMPEVRLVLALLIQGLRDALNNDPRRACLAGLARLRLLV